MTGLNGHQGRGDVSPPWNPFTFFGSGECREEEERLLMKATGAEELAYRSLIEENWARSQPCLSAEKRLWRSRASLIFKV